MLFMTEILNLSKVVLSKHVYFCYNILLRFHFLFSHNYFKVFINIFMSMLYTNIRGCSQIMSAKYWPPLSPLSAFVSISQTPPPPFHSHFQHFPNPPSLLCQICQPLPNPPSFSVTNTIPIHKFRNSQIVPMPIFTIRGCSQIMSAKNEGVQTPPPSPLCQPLSAFP